MGHRTPTGARQARPAARPPRPAIGHLPGICTAVLPIRRDPGRAPSGASSRAPGVIRGADSAPSCCSPAEVGALLPARCGRGEAGECRVEIVGRILTDPVSSRSEAGSELAPRLLEMQAEPAAISQLSSYS
eukprot:scaffold1345_cov581-Prasinococcus_capsulatus_cf.AAC.3